jgi:hypothetical protein
VEKVTVRPVVWVGVDAGKTAHHACVMDSEGKIVFRAECSTTKP